MTSTPDATTPTVTGTNGQRHRLLPPMSSTGNLVPLAEPVPPPIQRTPQCASNLPPVLWFAWSGVAGIAVLVGGLVGWNLLGESQPSGASVVDVANEDGDNAPPALANPDDGKANASDKVGEVADANANSNANDQPAPIDLDSAVPPALNATELAKPAASPLESQPQLAGPLDGPMSGPPAASPVLAKTVIESEAYAGEFYGVGKLKILFGNDAPEWKSDQTIYLMDRDGRIRYPAMEMLLAESADNEHPQILTIHYLFLGNSPLHDVKVGWADKELASLDRIQLDHHSTDVTGDSTHKELLGVWWKRYTQADLPRLAHHHTINGQIRRVLASRLGLALPRERKVADTATSLEKQFEGMVSTMFGIDSLLLTMPDYSLGSVSSTHETASRPLPSPLTLRSVPLPSVPTSVAVESLAFAVPEECFYLRCQSVADYQWLRSFLTDWGGSLEEIVSTPTFDRGSRDKLEHQLAIQMQACQDMNIEAACSDMAIIGCDLLFDEGAAIGVLFEAKDSNRLTEIIQSQRAKMQHSVSATSQTVRFDKGDALLLSTPDNSIRSFYAVHGKYHLVTNSEYIADRFHSAVTGQRSLGGLGEFRVARNKVSVSQSSRAFIYMSDPFFRHLASPQYRIELLRRSQAIAELEQLEVASLVAAQEGVLDLSLENLKRERYVAATLGQRADGSRPIKLASDFVDSQRGRRGYFLPVPDVRVTSASPSELSDYSKFAERYRRQWRIADPVVVNLASKRWGVDREKVSLQIYVTPYAQERYSFLATNLATASRQHVADFDRDLLSLSTSLRGGKTIQAKFGIVDEEVPFEINRGKLQLGGAFANSNFANRNFYAAASPAGTSGLQRLQRFMREFGTRSSLPDQPEFVRTETESGSRASSPSLVGLMVRTAVVLSKISTVPDLATKGDWTTATRREDVREYTLDQLRMDEDLHPAQMRLRLRDIQTAAVAPYVRAYTYLEARQASADNAKLLESLTQQLQLDPKESLSAAQRILDGKLVCPLSGEMKLRNSSGLPQWVSTAWTVDSMADIEEIPADYQYRFLSWLRGAEVRFQLSRTTLSADVELEVAAHETASVADGGLAIEAYRPQFPQSNGAVDVVAAEATKPADLRAIPVSSPDQITPGKAVVVLNPATEIRMGESVVATLAKGDVVPAIEVSGNWIGVIVESRGNSITGWVHFNNLGMQTSVDD